MKTWLWCAAALAVVVGYQAPYQAPYSAPSSSPSSPSPSPSSPSPSPLLPPRPVAVLTLHELSPAFQRATLRTPLKSFLGMLDVVARDGYQTFFASDVVPLLRGRDVGQLPGRRAVVFTFDDGYRSNYDLLFPILKKHKLKATIFLIVGKVQDARRDPRSQALTWAEVREMHGSGLVEFGSHTYDMHGDLARELRRSDAPRYAKAVEADLLRSRRLLETRLGAKCTALAWPHGKRTPELIAAAQRAGFESIFNTRFALNVPGRAWATDLCRLNASAAEMTPATLRRRLDQAWHQAPTPRPPASRPRPAVAKASP